MSIFNDKPHEFVRFAAGADYRHVCAECRNHPAHQIHGGDGGNEREPERVGHPDNEPVSANAVRSAYAGLMDILDDYNAMVVEQGQEGDRVHLPFALQEVLALYIGEREAIESLKGTA